MSLLNIKIVRLATKLLTRLLTHGNHNGYVCMMYKVYYMLTFVLCTTKPHPIISPYEQQNDDTAADTREVTVVDIGTQQRIQWWRKW